MIKYGHHNYQGQHDHAKNQNHDSDFDEYGHHDP